MAPVIACGQCRRLTEERDRLRGALERLMLSRDASWTGGHDWEEALDEAAAALAGEGEAPCPFCGHDGPLCRDVWPTGQLLCTRPQGHVGDHVACLSSAGVHDAQRWARHATQQNGDCADWCRACEDEAKTRTAGGREP